MSMFIQHCEVLFSKIKQKRSIQECLNAASAASATSAASSDPYEPIWFVYYMFFAIHNPKMEEYINKKASTSSTDIASIIKNMIKRSQYTSTIVFRLYTHAYTNNGNVTHIYPKYKETHETIIKSYNLNHLKTTAVHIRREFTRNTTTTIPSSISALIEHITVTATATTTATTTATNILNLILQKIQNIQYKHKDVIILALVCHMKIDDEDINTKTMFISATPNDIITTTETEHVSEELTPSQYDIKYKYLYS